MVVGAQQTNIMDYPVVTEMEGGLVVFARLRAFTLFTRPGWMETAVPTEGREPCRVLQDAASEAMNTAVSVQYWQYWRKNGNPWLSKSGICSATSINPE